MRRKGFLIGGIALVVLAAAWAGRDTYATARIGTAYVAKQTCSCLFIARRSPESCRTDYEAAALEPLDVATTDDGVTVSAVGGLVSAKARFEEGFGCHVVN